MDIDEALATVGGYGPWQLCALVVVGCTAMFGIAFQALAIVFIGQIFPHHCRVDVGPTQPLNASVPIDDVTGDFAQCVQYDNSSVSNVTVGCTEGWVHSAPPGETTIVMEWDLVCQYTILSDLTQVYFQCGAFIGEIAASMIADRFGRRWALFVSHVMSVASGVGLAFVRSYTAFAALKGVSAIASSAACAVGTTYLFELFATPHRSMAGVVVEAQWTVAVMVLTLCGWLIRDWRQLQLVLSIIMTAGLANILFPESPLWLAANHRYKDAEQVLRKMAKYNCKNTPDIQLEAETDPEVEPLDIDDKKTAVKYSNTEKKLTGDLSAAERTGHETIFDLWRWPLLRKYTIIGSFLQFNNHLVYYFLILNTPNMSGDFYRNFLIGGLIEVPAFIIAAFVLKRGRRLPTCFFQCLAAASLLTVAFLPSDNGSTETGWTVWSRVSVAVTMVGKFAITTSFTFGTLYTREFFPTNLRSTAAGVCIFLARIGSIFAPFAVFLARNLPWLPNLVLGILSLAVGLTTLLLPETRHWSLPQSIADVHKYAKGNFPKAATESQSYTI